MIVSNILDLKKQQSHMYFSLVLFLSMRIFFPINFLNINYTTKNIILNTFTFLKKQFFTPFFFSQKLFFFSFDFSDFFLIYFMQQAFILCRINLINFISFYLFIFKYTIFSQFLFQEELLMFYTKYFVN